MHWLRCNPLSAQILIWLCHPLLLCFRVETRSCDSINAPVHWCCAAVCASKPDMLQLASKPDMLQLIQGDFQTDPRLSAGVDRCWLQQ